MKVSPRSRASILARRGFELPQKRRDSRPSSESRDLLSMVARALRPRRAGPARRYALLPGAASKPRVRAADQNATYLPEADQIIEHPSRNRTGRDVAHVISNGGLGGSGTARSAGCRQR
jgi:hypothetical protein